MSTEELTIHQGKKSTFIIEVQHRENATWQGSIVWGEKNIKRHFRSTLEMLKMIDSTYCTHDDEPLDQLPVFEDSHDKKGTQ